MGRLIYLEESIKMRVRIARICHCVIKNEITEFYECTDRNEALDYAQKLVDFLHKNHCKAHKFFIQDKDDEILIDSKFNTDDITI